MGGTHGVWRGAGKAEAAKLPDAGISLKQCPRKCVAEKGWRTELGRSVQPYFGTTLTAQCLYFFNGIFCGAGRHEWTKSPCGEG
jgi:hypothetical protein